MTDPDRQPPYRVTRGGEPDAAQAAAIAAAVAEFARVAEVEAAQAARPRTVPPWTRAALVESTAGVTVRTPHDLPAAPHDPATASTPYHRLTAPNASSGDPPRRATSTDRP